MLSILVEDIDGMEFVGAGCEGQEAIELVARTGADVLVLDLDMPDHDGMFALERIRAADDHVWIIVYSGVVTPEARLAATAAGADVIVRKDETLDRLEEALLEGRDRGPRDPRGRFSRAAPEPRRAPAAGGRSAGP
jgi:DNA-binding NarL/FixJ family response regulator